MTGDPYLETLLPSLDPGIADAVAVLMRAGIETFESCEGGQGHAYAEPTVRFHGERAEGFRALTAALENGLKVTDLRRVWPVIDGEPTGPWWEIVFGSTGQRATPAPERPMSGEPLDLDAVEARLSVANKELNRLCQEPRSAFRMSIPARTGYDSDLIIGDALRDSYLLVTRLRAAEAECARLRGDPRVRDGAAAELPAGRSSEEGAASTTEEAAIARVRNIHESAMKDHYVSARFPVFALGKVLAALDRATVERDAASGSAAALLEREAKLNSRIHDLEAQLAASKANHKHAAGLLGESDMIIAQLRAEIARLTATEDTPLGWVNVHKSGAIFLHTSEQKAKSLKDASHARTAVPVYERPPRATEPHVVGAWD